MKLKENINLTDVLKKKIFSNSDITSSSDGAIEAFGVINKVSQEVGEEKIVKRKIQKNKIKNLIGNVKMDKPIGKLFSLGKSTTNENARAKEQFKLDLKNDPDFNEFKKGENEFGTPNVSLSDPFIKKKKYKHVSKVEDLDEDWSEKYKKSIDCNNPKGFSQKAHCQGKKKKGEQSEATGSGSAGGFMAPVGFKKKCKKFPYCNQGDIKALNIWENETLKKVISNVSQKYNISEDVVKNIIAYEYDLIKS